MVFYYFGNRILVFTRVHFKQLKLFLRKYSQESSNLTKESRREKIHCIKYMPPRIIDLLTSLMSPSNLKFWTARLEKYECSSMTYLYLLIQSHSCRTLLVFFHIEIDLFLSSTNLTYSYFFWLDKYILIASARDLTLAMNAGLCAY